MKASQTSCIQKTETIAIALSCSLIAGPFALATPPADETNATAQKEELAKIRSKESSPKEMTEAFKENSVENSKEHQQRSLNETADSSATNSQTGEAAKTDSAKNNIVGTDTTADSNNSADKTKTEISNEEKLHDLAIFHWNLSKKYSKDGDLDLAETELDLAVMNWPDMKVAHRDLCTLSLMRFNIWRSIAEFMMTVGLGEAIPMTEDESSKLVDEGMVKHYKKGLVYARQQDWPRTINELELAVHLVSDDFAVQRALAFAYATQGNFSKAEEHYRATFELSPQDGSSRADLAYFLAKSGKVGEAEKEMEEAVKSQPKAAAYHVDLSWMAESRGDLNTASKELQEAVSLSPKHADLWAHLGRVLEATGQKSEAVEAYTKAVSLDHSLMDAKQALVRLQANTNVQEADFPKRLHGTNSHT